VELVNNMKYVFLPLVLMFDIIDFFILEPFCKIEDFWNKYKIVFYGTSIIIISMMLMIDLI